MKYSKHNLVLIIIVIAIGLSSTAGAFDVSTGFVVADPAMFPVGRIIPDGIQDASEIQFEDIDPFFWILVSGGDPSVSAYLYVRFETNDNPIFTVSSEEFEVSVIHNRRLDNYQLARINEIRLGQGSEQINANRLFPHMDGGMLSSGVYQLTVLLSTEDNWENALNNPLGIGSGTIVSHNVSQIHLLQPEENVSIPNYPVLVWNFPRNQGTRFFLEIVSGNPNSDPWTTMESATSANRLIDPYKEIVVEQYNRGGDFTAHIYTGTGDERPMSPGSTYFWRVTAQVPTMFADSFEEVQSTVYRFTYSPNVGGGDLGGDLGGDFGGDPGAGSGGSGSAGGSGSTGGSGSGGAGGVGGIVGGSGMEGGAPEPEPPIITLLRTALPEALFNAILLQIGDVNNYQLAGIQIDGRYVSLNDLAILILTGEIQIQSIAVN